jgi:hypothetical protein
MALGGRQHLLRRTMSVDCALHMKVLADKVRASETDVLQYNRDRRGLVPWEWYVCITDSTLVKYSTGLTQGQCH